jgi:multiple sugar transport system permease protein
MTSTMVTKRQRQWGLIVRHIVVRFFLYVLLLVLAFIFIFPFWAMFASSFMKDDEVFSTKPHLLPTNGINLTSYVILFRDYHFLAPLFNSFYIAIVRTAGIVFFSALAGFAFAKRHFPGRDKLLFIMMATMMLPQQATIIPWYLMMVRVFKWSNTYWPLWIPAWAPAFGILMMRQFTVQAIPDEMMDAAAIDGASVFGTFLRIVVPLITPGLAVLAILQFIGGFNIFLEAVLILSSPSKINAPIMITWFIGTQVIPPRWSMLFAAASLTTLPMLIFYFTFQKQLVGGLLSGALKG